MQFLDSSEPGKTSSSLASAQSCQAKIEKSAAVGIRPNDQNSNQEISTSGSKIISPMQGLHPEDGLNVGNPHDIVFESEPMAALSEINDCDACPQDFKQCMSDKWRENCTEYCHESCTMKIQNAEDLSICREIEANALKLDGHCCDKHCPGSDCDRELSSDGTNCWLDSLPTELLLYIWSFLDARFVAETLARVSRSFYALAHDENFWRCRLRKQMHGETYPAIPDANLNLARECVVCEEQYKYWKSTTQQSAMSYFRYNGALYGSVDTVEVMQNGRLLAAGSRDKYLNILDLSKLDSSNPASVDWCCVFSKANAHTGWIWSTSSFDGVLATGSWDTYVKFWDLNKQSEMRKVKTNSAVLCTHFEKDLLALGSFDSNVYQIDLRCDNAVVKKRYHTRPVLCLAANDQNIVTGSEDGTIVIFDRRAARVMQTLQLNDFAMSMSYVGAELWIGDRAGRLSLIDATNGDFSLVETYEIGHACKVTSVVRVPGAIFTSSTDKTVKVLQPSAQPRLITTLTQHTSDIAEVSFQNGVLACACSNFCVGIYVPHTDHN